MTSSECPPHLTPQAMMEQMERGGAADAERTRTAYQATYGTTAGPDKRSVFANSLREPQRYLFKRCLARYQVPDEGTVVEVGRGLGHLYDCHKNWRGFEYFPSTIELTREHYGQDLNVAEVDARALPLDDCSVDLLVSFDTLDQMPHIEKAFAEMVRVIKPGGIALLMPSWNYQRWPRRKVQLDRFGKLSLLQRLGELLIPLRSGVYFRLACCLPARLVREARLVLGLEVRRVYREVPPDIFRGTQGSPCLDNRAVAPTEAHAVLTYFVSRGWEAPSHPTCWARFRLQAELIVVRKRF